MLSGVRGITLAKRKWNEVIGMVSGSSILKKKFYVVSENGLWKKNLARWLSRN